MDKLKETNNRFELVTCDEMTKIDKINDALYGGAIQYFQKKGFLWVEVPTMTKVTGACENVDTLYALDHFGKQAYLAQTGQLFLESKIPSHKKVWTTITSSRAEEKVDSRHLNQFLLLEFEHTGTLDELLNNIEGTIKSMINNALDLAHDELKDLGRDIDELRSFTLPFNRITYTDAIKLLQKNNIEINWGDDFKHMHEMEIIKYLGNKPTFVTHFPKKIKFFNMRVNRNNEDIVNSCDLLMPYAGESVGSAEREDDYDILVDRLKESNMYKILSKRGVTIDTFKDYLDLIKNHRILHSGCGIGFNRVSQSVLGVNDIRITTNYPINAETLY